MKSELANLNRNAARSLLATTNTFILPSPLQEIHDEVFEKNNIHFYLKRDDQIHPEIGGNKWRKLKYNLAEAQKQGKNTLLTFGGAFSNHIYATAAAGKHLGFKTIGIIRGEELHANSSPTLKFAADAGMELHFMSREEYRNKIIPAHLKNTDYYFLPEGGTNSYALQGVSEIVLEIVENLEKCPDFLICPVGTGGTFTGLANGLNDIKTTYLLGVCVLKNGHYLLDEIRKLLPESNTQGQGNFEILWDFHQGGYAKTTPQLLHFMQTFEQKHQILLDQVYTAKMLFAVYSLAEQGYFQKNTSIIAIHTGGLQGRYTNNRYI